MPSRRLALVSGNQGPAVSIRGIKEPLLRVRGLPAGATVHVHVWTDDHDNAFGAVTENGDFPIHEKQWVQLNVSGAARHKTICEVISRAIA